MSSSPYNNNPTSGSYASGAVDRTDEFFATVEAFRRRARPQACATPAAPPSSESNPLSNHSAFQQATRVLGQAVQELSAKIESLRRVAQRKGFADQTSRVQELSLVITQDIKSLDAEIERLQQHMTDVSRGSTHTREHVEQVLRSLRSDLQRATLDFQQVLQKRSDMVKAESSRRAQVFGAAAASSASVRGASPASVSCSSLRQRHPPRVPDPATRPLLMQEPQAGLQQQQQQVQRGAGSAYVQDRAQAMQNIEATIQELGQMYQRFATLVAMQNEAIVRIDDNVGNAVQHTEDGYAQLLKFYEGLQGDRWLIIKVFMVLIVFAVLFLAVM